MEQSYYRIGEVSRATGLSKDTLHFYDKIGLLCPEHVDPRNGYRYYSLRNLWQLDIIAACRKLNIPLDTVRQILSLQDNAQIVDLLMEYRQEALRRSAYYQQVASDILWYQEEHRRIEAQKDSPPVVHQVWREAEQVIAGRYAVFLLRIRQERADFSPLLDWLAAHGEEADAVYAEELGLQLFPYMDDYACEVRAHLKEKTQKGA